MSAVPLSVICRTFGGVGDGERGGGDWPGIVRAECRIRINLIEEFG